MDYLELINNALEQYLPESGDIVSQAMKYSVRNGGKRIRPMLALEFCAACGSDPRKALPFACAVEMIHTYSLIHDDLPCMDDDDYRRGKPSCHKAYGEANALLAGDALLTLAFETAVKADLPAENIVRAVKELSYSAGILGMVGGQVLDLQNENKALTLKELEQIHNLKTGELIRVACVLGCIAAGADDEKIKAAEEYAKGVGLTFQIIDDILDVTSDAETLGKPIGSDAENQKTTYVSLLGIEKSEEVAAQLTEKAKAALEVFNEETDSLKELADKLQTRKK
ncbi:MAG: polyprenyl synthetase family protein [Clostridia bacterium]|nr:polyprenyl synthetase family protein [Clostridia bacterium]